jgi:hypothetical protein
MDPIYMGADQRLDIDSVVIFHSRRFMNMNIRRLYANTAPLAWLQYHLNIQGTQPPPPRHYTLLK